MKWLVKECLHVKIEQTRILTILSTIKIMLLSLYCGIFRTLAYLMAKAYSKSCEISKIMWHSENPGKFRAVYLDIFKHIQGISTIFRHTKANRALFRHIHNPV